LRFVVHARGDFHLGGDAEAELALVADGAPVVGSDVAMAAGAEDFVEIPAGHRFLGDEKHVGAEPGDFRGDEGIGALDEGHDKNERSDADDQAKKRERGAEFVRPERAESQAQSVEGEKHRGI
jgi:hypothetical protein